MRRPFPSPDNYFDIGHTFQEESQPWWYTPGDEDLALGRLGSGHYEYDRSIEKVAKGRIDHHTHQISLGYIPGAEAEARYALDILKMDYPEYDIWQFGHDVRDRPRRVHRGRRRNPAVLERLYHVTSSSRLPSIMQHGLRVGQSGGATREGTWADEYYGVRPIYVAVDAVKMPFYMSGEWTEIDAEGLEPVADLPSLVDFGAQIDYARGTLRFGESPTVHGEEEIAPLLTLMNEDGELDIADLVSATPVADAAMAVTGTAALLEDVPPERLRVIRP